MTAQPPAPAARCRACHADIEPGALRCSRCGAAQRDETCPHCGAIAGASPDDELRYRCDVCGGPRVPIADPKIKRSGREAAPLKKAQAALAGRGGWRAAGLAGGLLLGFDMLVLSLLTLIFGAGLGLVASGLVTVGVLGGFVFYALRRAKARGREIPPALDAAWLSVATDVANQSQGALTAKSLAASLGIAEPQSEELLALLEVNDVVRGAMTPGGDVAYSPRLRIDAPPAAMPPPAAAGAPAPADADALAAAEEEALAGDAAAALRSRAADVDPTKR